MNEIKFHNISFLLLMWLIPLLIAFFAYAGLRRRQALTRFAEANLLPLINTTVSTARRRWKAALVVAAFAFAVLDSDQDSRHMVALDDP